MPNDDEQRDAESRKLDALQAISIAIGTLGQSLTAIVQEALEQRRRFDSMDRKLDRLLQLTGASRDAGE